MLRDPELLSCLHALAPEQDGGYLGRCHISSGPVSHRSWRARSGLANGLKQQASPGLVQAALLGFSMRSELDSREVVQASATTP